MPMASRIMPPCRPDCPRRSITCHSDCADYAAYVQAKEADLARQREAKAEILDACIVRRNAVIRAGRKKRQKSCMKRRGGR